MSDLSIITTLYYTWCKKRAKSTR